MEEEWGRACEYSEVSVRRRSVTHRCDGVGWAGGRVRSFLVAQDGYNHKMTLCLASMGNGIDSQHSLVPRSRKLLSYASCQLPLVHTVCQFS